MLSKEYPMQISAAISTPGYIFIFLKMRLGMLRTTSMIRAQKGGT
jgi:hypothetical protein